MPGHASQTHPIRTHRFSISHVPALPMLATNRLLGTLAWSLTSIFLPIFLYEFFGMSIQAVLLWFIIDYAVKIPFYVPAAKLFSKIGLVASMVIGTLGVMIYYLSMYLLDIQVAVGSLGLIAMGIFGLLLVSVFYWSPFHVDFAEFTSRKHRGSQLSVLYAIQRVIGVLAPVTAAFVIAMFSYHVVFFAALIIVAFSVVPLFYIPRHDVQYEFGFRESFKKLFSRQFRSLTTSMMAHGAENVVGTAVWPVFLFVIFKGDYLDVGLFTTVIVVITLVLELFVGRLTDHSKKRRLLRYGTGIYAVGWMWKGLVSTVIGVFAASTFHTFGSILLRTPLDALMYEQAADSGHYVDEYTVLREMAMCMGRVLILSFLLLITAFFPLGTSFFVAAVATLGINWLAGYHAKRAT